jgi:drug/metabolite transporter (DMT)-like permease
VVGNTAYLWLLDRVSAPIVATYTFVNPVIAVILGMWVLGEQVSVPSLAGGVLVISSVASLLYLSAKHEPVARSAAESRSLRGAARKS